MDKKELLTKMDKLTARKEQLQKELATTKSVVEQETRNLGAAMLTQNPAAEGIGTRIASLRVLGEEGIQSAIDQADKEIEQLNLELERVDDETQKALEEFELIYPREVEMVRQVHTAFRAYFEHVKTNRATRASLLTRLREGSAHSQEIALRDLVFASEIVVEGFVEKLSLLQAIEVKICAYEDETAEKPAPPAAKPRGARDEKKPQKARGSV